MAAIKTALKAIKSSVDAKDFEKAVTQSRALINQDSKNYHALMFLGFAEEKLRHFDEAEKALQAALLLKPRDIQALKGLVTLYEQQGSLKLYQYHTAVYELAKSYEDLEDREQCQNVIDKYESFAKKHGSKEQYRHALELHLPTCDLYSFLEGRIPHPSHTYKRILESAEVEEGEWIASQISERRTRLGARLEQVTKEVQQESISRFTIEEKLQALIDWTIDDDARYEMEERLLERAYDNLQAVSAEEKGTQRDKVLTMANGMVIVKHRFLLAWQIAIEWVDASSLAEWDVSILTEFIEYFPGNGLAKVLRGFLNSKASPFPVKIPEAKEQRELEVLSEAEYLILISEGLDESQNSMLAHWITSETYLALEEDESAAHNARLSLKLYARAESHFAVMLPNSVDAINLVLANALITYQSPRYHPEARSIFQNILERKPLLTTALLGVGLIYEEDENYAEAVKFLKQALDRDTTNMRIRLEYAWCYALDSDMESGLVILDALLEDVNSMADQNPDMKAQILYRIAYCKWHLHPTVSARRNKAGPYRYLIDSIKSNPSYAPAYTLLGIYFQDYGKSKQRARVALQKAFELSTSELVAAQRLAKTFADSGEWDLVELVVQRVIDSGKARPAPGSKKRAVSWPYTAMGVVHINRQQYSKSIISFQAALRISPLDYNSWVGLGESYHNSGRYVAASRAFQKAESLDHGLAAAESWFAKYMLANVQREVGAFDDAIKAYEAVLVIKHDEFGVLLALLQTCVENAIARIGQGLYGYAVELSQKAIGVAQQLMKQKSGGFNLWKAVSDAFSCIGSVRMIAKCTSIEPVISLLRTESTDTDYSVILEIDGVDLSVIEQEDVSQADRFLLAAVLANKRALQASSHDKYAQAVAWYNLGWAEYQAYSSLEPQHALKNRRPMRLLKAAMRCFKCAIELEAGNADFWAALGVSALNIAPKIAQHSFVRSLHLNERSARNWTNLGMLYLFNNDSELANAAFTRAQSVDPEFTTAWIGQGLLAMGFDKDKEGRDLFAHAFGIADSSSIPAKKYFAASAFDEIVSGSSSQELSRILQPLFALYQLRSQQPSDITTSHTLSLCAERIGEFETATASLEDVCTIAEVEYESSESMHHLVHYAQAKADLARACLARCDFEAALVHAETAIDLSAEDIGGAFDLQRKKWRLSAHITAGLAHSHLGAKGRSIEMFQVALEESQHGPEVVCMLAQILWAKGSQSERDAARSQLFGCVENYPGDAQAVSLLAVIGLLDNDQDVLDAVEEELKGFRVSDAATIEEKVGVSKILLGLTSCSSAGNYSESAAVADATQVIMLRPAEPQGWLELATLSQSNEAAEMALTNAINQVPPHGTLSCEELAIAFAGTGTGQDAQIASILAPWLWSVPVAV